MYQRTKASTHYIIQVVQLVILGSLLTACFQKTLTPAEENSSLEWSQRKQTLQSLSQWTLRGKAAFQSPQGSGSATFEWKQQGESFSFTAFSPLGNEEFKLQGGKAGATLQMANGKRYEASNSEELLNQRLGFALPLSSLTYWVRGIPDPTLEAHTQFDRSHRLAELQQGNWQVNFQSYTTISGTDVPRLIMMTTPVYKTKVIIYDWQIS